MIKNNMLELKKNESISHKIYQELRALIVNCTFKPGERLIDKDLAEKFEVSKQPVRDAFTKLAEDGLLNIRPQCGTFVMKITPQEVENSQYIREAIEIAIARRASVLPCEGLIKTLRNNLDAQKIAFYAQDKPALVTLDEQFHHALIAAVAGTSSWNAIRNIKANMDRVNALSVREKISFETQIEEHEQIVESIIKKDPDAAELAVKNHLRGLFFSLSHIVEKNPEWFDI